MKTTQTFNARFALAEQRQLIAGSTIGLTGDQLELAAKYNAVWGGPAGGSCAWHSASFATDTLTTCPCVKCEDRRKWMRAPVRRMHCCCCGAATFGRQWHNWDIGYGLCPECDHRLSQKYDEAEMLNLYGQRGIHYSPPQDQLP